MKNFNKIKNWAEDDRPREKLILKGIESLSDAELVAILIGSGNNEESAVDLAKRILKSSNNNLNEFAKVSLDSLKQFKGIGEAKAINILAAMELGRRRKISEAKEKNSIKTSSDAYDLLNPYLTDKNIEQFWVVYLNRANKVIDISNISSGGITGTIVDIRLIFKQALLNSSTGIIVAHNHPSGNEKPSKSDIDLTKKIKEAGLSMDINLLDHIIISNNKYYSFADEGMI